MSTLIWNEARKEWFNEQTREWWKICEVCKEHKHKSIYPRCQDCTLKGKK
jgi:hypothetical protein